MFAVGVKVVCEAEDGEQTGGFRSAQHVVGHDFNHLPVVYYTILFLYTWSNCFAGLGCGVFMRCGSDCVVDKIG